MGKTYQSGIGTTKDRRGQIAPLPTADSTPELYSGATPPDRGTLVRRGNAKTGDPGGGNKANRAGTLERHGARHRIEVPLYPAQAPEAAATQANGRIIPSYPKMQDAWSSQDFWSAG